MTRKLSASLRQAPATVPALVAMGLFVLWATDQAGYPLTHWAPGGLVLLALLVVALGGVGLRLAEVPAPVRLALGALAGYTALSFLSILWAAVPGDAWEGANRTLIYLAVFALFALWRQRGASAALLLGAWTFALVGLAAFTVLHVDAASSAELQRLVPFGRLVYPTGYANASAALWLMAFWPALLMARSELVPWAIRGALAGGAVLLAEVALLSQSRGSLYATPVMLVLVFALAPGRRRTFALLVPVAAGIAAAAPAVLRVGNDLKDGAVSPATMHTATIAIFSTTLAVALVVAVGAAIESHATFSEVFLARIRRSIGVVAVATLVAALAAGWVAAGDPLARVEHGWHTFQGGYAANSTTGSRLTRGLGSSRYDFYRVALNEFAAHPLLGIGVDNFQQQYLRHGRGHETPRYPHSVELRSLSQTGLVGTTLALVGLGAALLAARRAARLADPLGRTVAVAALAGFAYWLVHGSVDWFWEFAGLGAPAFALLGLACALAPSPRAAPAARAPASDDQSSGAARSAVRAPQADDRRTRERGPSGLRQLPVFGVLAALAALAAVAALALPWLSTLQVQEAARIWAQAPRRAYARLEDAARLNPLSDQGYLLAGNIALRFGDLARADREFLRALARVPGDPYAVLERGAIASTRGERHRALLLLRRAVELNPRDALTLEVLALVREGRRVGVEELNRSILLKAQQLT